MKILLVSILLTYSTASFAVNLAPVVRDENRGVIHMTAQEASTYCDKIGSRLPTAYEIAIFFNPSGVKFGPKLGFEPIKINEDHQAFFYNYQTYTPVDSGPWEYFDLWSSSVRIDYSYASNPYQFNIFSGRLIINVDDANETVSSVRCIY
jgi:hypothetical protein